MRLTLRTLLAYLDDMLEPAQARMIGQKVAESETARDVIARIKQVTRRRRLTIPPVTGPGARLDPNVIAEYLDNVLAADKLAEVEEICLSSDVHLAEVAACHQILTLVLGEPALIPPTARRRMYRLIQGRESQPDREIPASAIGRGALEGRHFDHDDRDEALLLGLPIYQRSHTWLRWLVPFIAACLLLASGIAIGMALLSNRPPLPQLEGAFSESDHVARRADREEPVQKPLPEHRRQPAKQPVEAPKNPKEDEKKPAQVIKPSPKDQTEQPKAPAPPSQQPALIASQPPSTDRRELGKVYWSGSPASVLLQRSSEVGPWQRIGLAKRVSSNDDLVSLPGCRCEIQLDSGLALQLWGNLPQFSPMPLLESAVTLHSDPVTDLDFTLDHGRALIINRKTNLPARVRLRFRNQVCELKLLDKNTEVAVDLIGICPPYIPEPRPDPETHVRIYALRGQLQLATGSGEHRMSSLSVYDWDNYLGYVAQPTALPRPPDWWTSRLPTQTSAAREMESALDALGRRLAAKDRVEVSLAEALKDSDQNVRVVAVRFLGATAELPKVLDCLADERYADIRVMAIEELRHLLALGSQNDEKILTVLKQKNYSEAQAQIVLQLLHGFSLEQWSLPATRGSVVDYLNNEKVAIRQIAHTLLITFVPEGQKIRFDAAGSPDQRERGLREWQRLVLAPKPKAKTERTK